MESDCICKGRSEPLHEEDLQYPEWRDGADNVAAFKQHGYLVIRGLFSGDEVESTKGEISRICREWLDKLKSTGEEGKDWEEIANRMPARQGQDIDQDSELSIRRLFRMAVHDKYFEALSRHPRIVAMATEILGPDIKLLQSMSLLKPPGSGEKKWHQDNAYFRLTPSNIMGCWIALETANCSNGCMHVLPSSHGYGVYKHDAPLEHHIDYGMVELPRPHQVLPVILNAGDAMIFHGETAHYTPPNVSQTRRRAVQFHYASSYCKPQKCPRAQDPDPSHHAPTHAPRYFDCDPSCQEPEYWYYRKAEILVTGKDLGNDYI